MDPVSVTASAIAIIQLTTELLTTTRKYYKSAKSAPGEIAELIDELTAFGVVLEHLKTISQNARAVKLRQNAANGVTSNSSNDSCLPMLQKMMEQGGPLTICYDEMLAFKMKLAEDQSKLKKSLKWPFRKDEIQAVLHRLRNLKAILDTAISSDQLYVSLSVPAFADFHSCFQLSPKSEC